jgi:Fe-S-cluster containining protein
VTDKLPDVDASPCTACGACCAYAAAWPRFWTDADDAIAALPPNLVAEDGTGMACDGDRCRALVGVVGEATRCSIYSRRPEVCRACQPGDDACHMARAHYRLPPIIPPEGA